MEVETRGIQDLNVYTSGMAKSLEDKLWFLDKLPESVAVVYDYGCADGTLLGGIQARRPELQLFGYDISEEMLKRAKRNVPGATFTEFPIQEHIGPGMLLVASSVFHEIHAYSKSIKNDYQNIFGIGSEYIAIRDMMYSEKSDGSVTLEDEDRLRRLEPKKRYNSSLTCMARYITKRLSCTTC